MRSGMCPWEEDPQQTVRRCGGSWGSVAADERNDNTMNGKDGT